MRILVIPSSYSPVLGGLQAVAHTLSRELARRGHQVRVVTNRYPRRLPAQEIVDGVPVSRWMFLAPRTDDLRRRPDLFSASLYFYPATLFRLVRLARSFRPEVIHVHFPDSQLAFVAQLCRRYTFRLVVSLHGNDINRWFDAAPASPAPRTNGGPTAAGATTSELQFALRRADAVTACSRDLLKKAICLEPSVGQKGYVIHNGADTEQLRDAEPYHHPRPYILAYGRFTPQKGFDLLVRAFASVAARHTGADVIMAGDGEERAALEQMAAAAGLRDRIVFCGRVTPHEVASLLKGCMFVVVPSRLEGFGMAALEALAAGKPLLATNVGGLPELVAEAASWPEPWKEAAADANCGVAGPGSQKTTRTPPALLVKPDVNDLALGISKLLDAAMADEASAGLDPNPRSGPGFAAEAFSWARVVDRYEAVLRGGGAQ